MHQIRREKRPTISEVIVCGKRIKHNGNWLYFNFSVESLSFKLNNFKTEKFSFCQNLLHFTRASEANRDGSDAASPFLLFFSLLRTLAREKRSENCLRFGTGGPNLCLYLLLSRNIIFCPALTMAACAKKNFWLSNLLMPSVRECTIEIWSTLTYTKFDCVALLAML